MRAGMRRGRAGDDGDIHGAAQAACTTNASSRTPYGHRSQLYKTLHRQLCTSAERNMSSVATETLPDAPAHCSKALASPSPGSSTGNLTIAVLADDERLTGAVAACRASIHQRRPGFEPGSVRQRGVAAQRYSRSLPRCTRSPPRCFQSPPQPHPPVGPTASRTMHR